MGRPRISIITIHCGDSRPLRKTVESLKPLQYFEQVFVLSACDMTDAELRAELGASCEHITFVRDKDKSLYDAMNLGLDAVRGEFVWLVNSGDTALADPTEYLEPNTGRSYSFSTIQTWAEDYYLRSSQNTKTGKLKFSHQGFVANMDVVRQYQICFDTAKVISADVHWMRQIESVASVVAVAMPIAMFELGGLSSNPTPKSIATRFRYESQSSASKEVVKLFLRALLGQTLYYRALAAMNGYEKLQRPSS